MDALIKQLKQVMDGLEEYKVVAVNHGSTGTEIHLRWNVLRDLSLDLKAKKRPYCKDYTHEVYSEILGIKLFAIVTEEELKEHFSQLNKEVAQ